MSVYAISDLHGRYDLYQQVKEFLKPEDKVICLGDCGDRGSDSWKTIKAVYYDPQFEYFLGNHEHLLAHAMIHYLEGESTYYVNALQDCINNGGHETLRDWIKDGMDKVWIRNLLYLPRTKIYNNESGIEIILSHAGYTPTEEYLYPKYDYNIIWDRKHMKEDWPQGKEFQNILVIHGHTPIQLVDKDAKAVIWYGDGHKIDIDCGSVWSGRTCLFDLNTFDEHYFQGPKGDE